MTQQAINALVIQEDVRSEIEVNCQFAAPLLEAMGIQVPVFMHCALNAITRKPELLDADRHSLMVALMNCAQTGLVPDDRQAALVVIEDRVGLWPMVDGRLMLARAATPGLEVWSKAIFADDEFVYKEGTKLVIEHSPAFGVGLDKRTWPDLIGVYAVATAPSWQRDQCEVLSRAEINEFIEHSPAKKGPWANWPIEMARVRAMNRLLKRLPAAGAVIDQPGDMIQHLSAPVQTQVLSLTDDDSRLRDVERQAIAEDAAQRTAAPEPAVVEPAANGTTAQAPAQAEPAAAAGGAPAQGKPMF